MKNNKIDRCTSSLCEFKFQIGRKCGFHSFILLGTSNFTYIHTHTSVE